MKQEAGIKACLLCHDAPCSKVCSQCDPARILRALRFENDLEAAALLPDAYDPAWMEEVARVCPAQVPVGDVLEDLHRRKQTMRRPSGSAPVDLSCSIGSVRLENPFLLSSSVVASDYEKCARAFEMGWAGAAFKTISMMEMHEASPRYSSVRDMHGDWYGFKNIEQLSERSVEENMECIRALKRDYPSKVIISSIMGRNEEEWEYLARESQKAGADVVECNFSCPNMEAKGTGSDVGQDPDTVRRYSAAARKGTDLPLLAKMTPNITDITVPARASIEGGADGLAAINTIKSITGVNLHTLVAYPSVHGRSMVGGYSGRAVKPVALRQIAQMASDEALKGCHISGMGGIVTWKDAVEFMLLGAGSLQITTAVMEYGYRIIDDLISGLRTFMEGRGYKHVDEFIGAGLGSIVENDMVERDTIVYPVIDREKCVGCGRCYVSCRDGGHDAMTFQEEDRSVKVNGKRCVGCHLCMLVCPADAISRGRRVSKPQ